MVSFDELKRKWGVSSPFLEREEDLKYKRLPRVASAGSPEIDAFENAREVVVIVHLPNYSRENIRLKIFGDGMSVKAGRNLRPEGSGKWFTRGEEVEEVNEYVRFPSDTDASKARASFKNGVLEVVVPKKSAELL
ncbi:MAG: Hsp20/alpha crystallin family protein [Candidatus Micrarchaeia archaeon]|jgi:HSP20 family protein